MLSYMRKNASSWFIKVLLGVIVLVFVFWGIGSFADRPMGRVATVNGEAISQGQYDQAFKRLVRYYERQFQERLDQKTIEKLNLKELALEELVNARLWDQKARALGLSVPASEVATNIAAQPMFWSGGSFSPARYQQVLKQLNYSEQNYEEDVRAAMLHDKLVKLVSPNAHLSSSEARDYAAWAKLERNINYVAFEPSSYTLVDVSEDMAKAYYEAHKEDYRTDPMLRVSYLLYRPGEFLEDVTVTEEATRNYYADHPDEFTVPKTVEAQHVLIRVGQNASEEEVEEARKKAEDVAAKAKAGEDFDALARQYSQDSSSVKGGHLGAFEKKSMVQPFGDKAFSMAEGEISEPVRTFFGWHVIKLNKINEEHKKSLEEATPSIQRTLSIEEAREKARTAANQGMDACLGAENLKAAAATLNKQAVSTDFFAEASPPPNVPSPMELSGQAFGLPVDEYSSVLDFPEGFCILQVEETKPAEIPSFEDVKAEVMEDLEAEESRKMAEEDANKLLVEARKGRSLQDLAGDRVKETGFFTRTGAVPDIGQSSDVLEQAFLLTEKNPLPEKPLLTEDAVYVISYAGEREPDEAVVADEAKQAARMLVQSKEDGLSRAITDSLRADAVIEYEPKFAPKKKTEDQL